MIRSLYTAATGMNAQQLNMDVIANNLANVNTNGFKRGHATFQDMMYQTTRSAGSASGQGSQVPTGIQVGLGVRTSGVERVHTQGDLRSGNTTDLVIEGNGFFKVQLPNGQAGYTRDGSFKLDNQGRMVTSDGYVLQPELTIPQNATNTSISQDGSVTVTLGDGTQQAVGKITVANFANPAGLSSVGRNLFTTTPASGNELVGDPGTDGRGTIQQGMIEMSNVKVVEEMVDMITAQRAYEVSSKSIQASDEMLQIANGLRR